jgi:hypothetical protein
MSAQYVGGIRDRLIHESLVNLVTTGLTQIGWFNSNRTHDPLTILPEQKHWDEDLAYNTITIAPDTQDPEDWELGAYASKTSTVFYIDVYGQNEALGQQISGDIRDIVQGKFSAQGVYPGQMTVMDYTQATPVPAFVVEINNVTRDRARNWPHKFQRFLYIIRLEVVDYYTRDNDANYNVLGAQP